MSKVVEQLIKIHSKVEQAYLKSKSIHAYRDVNGCNGLIIGLEFITPRGRDKRLCYKVLYPTNELYDYVPVSDVIDGAYEIVDCDK